MRRLGLLICSLFMAFGVLAQDVQFTQYYAAPLLLNPGFTGNTEQGRGGLNYRNQWPAVPNSKSFVTYSAYYDHNLRNLNSGMGFVAMRDAVGNAGLTTTTFAFSYAYQAKINRKLSVKPALQLGVLNRSIDFSKLVFGDQLNTGKDVSVSNAGLAQESSLNLDVAAGILGYTKRFWFGGSMYHINKPNSSLLANVTPMDQRISVHAGAKFPIKKSIKGHTVSDITFTFNYKRQVPWEQLDVGGYFAYYPILFGLWYRGIPISTTGGTFSNPEALNVLLGFKSDYGITVGYSYDITISQLTAAVSGGAHEISITFEYENPRRKRRRPMYMFIPCPKF